MTFIENRIRELDNNANEIVIIHMTDIVKGKDLSNQVFPKARLHPGMDGARVKYTNFAGDHRNVETLSN